MRAFVVPGFREIPDEQERRQRLAQRDHFDRGRDTTPGEINRENRERDETDEQPGREERAVTRGEQRILARARMNQCVEISPDGR